ncbi:MAG: hypothetical protein LH650_04665 [Chloroflexi bacterium]|nr:hypothetical protein [Chloroflexota bacterium]
MTEPMRAIRQGKERTDVTRDNGPLAIPAPVTERPMFTARDAVLRIIREAPLDARFEGDVAILMGDRLGDVGDPLPVDQDAAP